MRSIWERVYWGNTLSAYLIAAGGILITWIIIRIFKKYILQAVEKLTKRTNTTYDDLLVSVIEKFIIPWVYLFINYNIIKQLNLSVKAEKIIDGAMAFIAVFYGVRLVNHVMQLLIGAYMRRKGESEERIRHLNGMLVVVKAIVWIIGLLTFASNLGFNISTLVTSLGVGGIAIALASQVILGDLFSYLVIFFDKPFEIGDFVILNNDVMGAVEYIGIKTTRIRSLSGEQLILSNTSMTNSVIRNYKRMERRRVIFRVSVTYQTPHHLLRAIPQMIADIIKSQEDVLLDRSHLADYGTTSINFEMVYYMLSADYNKYMDTQQEILYRIHQAFEKQGIEFATPVQTLFVRSSGQENGFINGQKMEEQHPQPGSR